MPMTNNIAVFDWGTTNLRVHVVQPDGQIANTTTFKSGIKLVPRNSILTVFKNAMSGVELDYDPMPAILVGMVGSNFGWHEVSMQPGPLGVNELAGRLFRVPDAGGRDAIIVPGVTGPSVVGSRDMMRGEETQAFGAMQNMPHETGMLCMPGTHTKWVKCEAGKIKQITTAMTCEVMDFLCKDSVLRTAVAESDSETNFEVFAKGAQLGASGVGALLTAFSTRAESLSAQDPLSPSATKSHLSGVMIGSEIAAMEPYLGDELTIVGDPQLCSLYARACEELHIRATCIDGNVAVAAGARTVFDLYAAR